MAERAVSPRQVAREAGEKKYLGMPCPHGHAAVRWVYNGACTECANLASRANSKKNGWKAQNAYKKANPDAVKRWKQRYRCSDKAKCVERLYGIKRNAEKREELRTYNRDWLRKNPERMRVYNSNNKAKRKLADGSFTRGDVDRLFSLQKGKCIYCKTPLRSGYHIDHKQPIALGGTNWPSNLQLLCEPCNLKKGAKDPIDFAQAMGALL